MGFMDSFRKLGAEFQEIVRESGTEAREIFRGSGIDVKGIVRKSKAEVQGIFRGRGAGKEKTMAEIVAQIKDVESWVQTQMPIYNRDFVTDLPKEQGYERLLHPSEIEEMYAVYVEQAGQYIFDGDFSYEVFDFCGFYPYYKRVKVLFSMALRMASHVSSYSFSKRAGLQEAKQYYETVFCAAEDLCATVSFGAKSLDIETRPYQPLDESRKVDSDRVAYQNGERMLRYRDEFAQCLQFISMLQECLLYSRYLIEYSEVVYRVTRSVVDHAGNSRRLLNVEQSMQNLFSYHTRYAQKYYSYTADATACGDYNGLSEEEFLKMMI